MRRRAWLVVALPLVLAACSGGGSNQALDLAPTPSLSTTAPATSAATGATAPSATTAQTSAASASPTHTTKPSPTHRSTTTRRPAPTHPDPTHTTKPSPTKSAGPTPYVIQAKDYFFSPANPTVKVGTPVKVIDKGSSSHTWTSGTAPVHTGPFDSGNLDPGQSYTYTFNTSGTYNFFCQYHYSSGMKGRITVQ